MNWRYIFPMLYCCIVLKFKETPCPNWTSWRALFWKSFHGLLTGSWVPQWNAQRTGHAHTQDHTKISIPEHHQCTTPSETSHHDLSTHFCSQAHLTHRSSPFCPLPSVTFWRHHPSTCTPGWYQQGPSCGWRKTS